MKQPQFGSIIKYTTIILISIIICDLRISYSQYRQPSNKVTGLDVIYDDLSNTDGNHIRCLPWNNTNKSVPYLNLALISQNQDMIIDTVLMSDKYQHNIIKPEDLQRFEKECASILPKDIIISGMNPKAIIRNGYIIYYTKDFGQTATPSFDICIIPQAAILRIEKFESRRPIYRIRNIRQVTY